jgi:hypothetical protein
MAYLETICAMHENEHWIGKLLNQGKGAHAPEGIAAKRKGQPVESMPVVFTNTEHVSGFAPIVIALIRKKTAIDYPTDTSLVVQCHLNTLYTQEEWRLLISKVETEISATRFREILLFDEITQRATPLAVRVQ